MKRLVPAALALSLALVGACETSPVGPPLGGSAVALETGRYRVVFRGVSGASGPEVQDRALLYAANLALGQRYDWFRVAGRAFDLAPPTRPRVTIGVGGASFGRGGGFGFGAAQSTGGEPSPVAELEVVLGRGPKPAGPDVYDARSVVESLGPRLAPPPARSP